MRKPKKSSSPASCIIDPRARVANALSPRPLLMRGHNGRPFEGKRLKKGVHSATQEGST